MLLGQLLLETKLGKEATSSNIRYRSVPLSDSEANELYSRIEQLVDSREFLEATHFVETLTLPDRNEEKVAREIYLASRQRRGRSRIQASSRWLEFRTRLGLPGPNLISGRHVAPMSFDHFQAMEKRLLDASGVPQEVVAEAFHLIKSRQTDVDEIRTGHRPIQHGTLRRVLLQPFLRWGSKASPTVEREVTVEQVSAAMLLVADASVLFTTRDWGVTGTISTMASGAIVLTAPRS
jgi:hypothetical protein